MQSKKDNILVVDDSEDFCFLLSNILNAYGYAVNTMQCGRKALQEIRRNPPDIILLDIHLPDIDGMKVLAKLKKSKSIIPVVMLTAYGAIKDAVEAIKAGAFDYITKPFNEEELLLVIERALQNRDLNQEMDYLRQALSQKSETGNIIGESSAIHQIIQKVKVIAPTNMTVVIHGESGVGKELVADLIHRESLRKGKPYIPIDCGAIPESLVESELFGHEKGAFTGAIVARKGKFEQAEGGTLFLDEVTNLPDAAQAKLLRVLEDRKICPIGASKAINIDVRIIAATNVEIAVAVKHNKFREDLFYRLNEFNIKVPPLRERKDDIVAIANHFIEKANVEFNKQVKGISAEAIRMFIHYPWHGNIRELRNVIKMAVLSAESDYITLSELPAEILEYKEERQAPQALQHYDHMSLDVTIGSFEAQLIRDALTQTGGNKVKAADLLQIDRKALYRKMHRLGLE